jgi:hypothetical protein
VDPRGIYDNLELPLVSPYNGDPLVDVAFELVDGPNISNGAEQASITARFATFLEQNMGLAGNMQDDLDFALLPNNSILIDPDTNTIKQRRNGVIETVSTVAAAFVPRGAWSGATTYARSDLVSYNGYAYVSNANGNLNNTPPTGASNANWTYFPVVSPLDDVVRSDDVTSIVKLTQTEYDALSPPNPTTLYVIVGV